MCISNNTEEPYIVRVAAKMRGFDYIIINDFKRRLTKEENKVLEFLYIGFQISGICKLMRTSSVYIEAVMERIRTRTCGYWGICPLR